LEDASITVLQKCKEPLTKRHTVTFQKTQNFSNAALRMSVSSIYIVTLSIRQSTVYSVR